jgi:hypothetical protein
MVNVLIGFVLCLVMVSFVGLGFVLGRKQRKFDLEQPTEKEIRQAEDLNRQANELFNYTADTAYGGKS